jgi:hypothetical protein
MDKKKKYLENILKDIDLGMIEGLEEMFLEYKLETGTITRDHLKQMLNQVEKKYKVHYKNIISHFPESLTSLKISQILQVLKTLTLEKLSKLSKNIQNPEENEDLVLSPLKDHSKLSVLEFNKVSFNEFMYRVDLHTDWITEHITRSNPKEMLKDLMNKCKLQVTEDELKTFGKEMKKIFSPEYDFAFSDFRALTFAWYEACHSFEDLRSKLLKTISEFEEIRAQKLPDHEKSSVKDLLVNLKSKLKELPNYEIREENFENKCIEGITQIFKFYSKQQFLIGKTPTFDSIKSNTEVLTLGKFIQFCKDFQILKEDSKEKTKIMSVFLRQVFIQTAEFSRNMAENHFLEALEKISDRFFDKSFDKENNTRWSQLPVDDKRLKFFEYLNFHRPEIYSAKLKGLIPHFGIEQNDRIPDYDLAKNYKSKPDKVKAAKVQIEEWKRKKDAQREKREVVKTERVQQKGYSGRYQRIRFLKSVGRNAKESEFSDD